MKQIFLIAAMCLLIIGCAKQKPEVAPPIEQKVELIVPISAPVIPTQEQEVKSPYSDLADGTHNWTINADHYGSSVENFGNAAGKLAFRLNRAVENPEKEQWTWSEIIYFSPSSFWNPLTSIDITYTADQPLVVILADSELSVYNPAAGFFTILPPTETETSLTLVLEDKQRFRQHDWVIQSFPQIRTVIDATTIIGIKLGTTAIGGKANVTISRFILNGVVLN